MSLNIKIIAIIGVDALKLTSNNLRIEMILGSANTLSDIKALI